MSSLSTGNVPLPKGVEDPLLENCSDDRNKLDAKFDQSVLPEGYQDYLTIEITNGNSYIANTGPYVGIIPCTDGSFLPILPKENISNLTNFLLKSGRIVSDLNSPFDQSAPYSTVISELVGMHELVIEQLLSELDRLKRNGLLKRRVTKPVESKRMEGRVDARAYSKNVLAGQPQTIPQRKSTYSLDNLPNQFLKFTLESIVDSNFIEIEKREIVDRLDYFRPVDPIDQSRDLTEVRQQIDRLIAERELPPSRSYYFSCLELAQLIINGGDITFEKEVNHKFRSFMFNMYDAFEDYIRNVAEEKFAEIDYNTYNGNKSAHSIEFYKSRSDGSLDVKPDIIISDGIENIGVIDVKYKRELTSGDHYQLWCYKQQYEVDFAGFISIPIEEEQRNEEKNYYRRKSDDKISHFQFHLGDLAESEKELGEFLQTAVES